MGKRILLATVYVHKKNQVYDYFESNSSRRFFRFRLPRIESFGLRFIKQNVPEVEILEYPTWEEYKTKLEEGWDIVGFSFYLNEIHEILGMVKYAREKGIKEVWAGNYGALTESIQKHFDKVFIGYSEDAVAKVLGKKVSNENIVHPPLVGYASTLHGIKLNCMGYLFTARGCCNNRCDFCQTPPFCKKPYKIPLESIENVLKYYRSLGITEIIILDENFGMFRGHSEDVVSLLHKYGFYWFPMVRADLLGRRLEDWSKKGMIGALTGIESFNQETLDTISKRESIDEILFVIKKLKKMQKFTVGYYMIGFENETEESIKKDLKQLAKLKLDITQICILTPLPGTPQWYRIEKEYGIFDRDWHHYNAKHLVWNHPNVTPQKMRELLLKGFRMVYPRRRMIETSFNFIRNYVGYRGFIDGMRYSVKHFIHANAFNYFPREIRMLPFEESSMLKGTPLQQETAQIPAQLPAD